MQVIFITLLSLDLIPRPMVARFQRRSSSQPQTRTDLKNHVIDYQKDCQLACDLGAARLNLAQPGDTLEGPCVLISRAAS